MSLFGPFESGESREKGKIQAFLGQDFHPIYVVLWIPTLRLCVRLLKKLNKTLNWVINYCNWAI